MPNRYGIHRASLSPFDLYTRISTIVLDIKKYVCGRTHHTYVGGRRLDTKVVIIITLYGITYSGRRGRTRHFLCDILVAVPCSHFRRHAFRYMARITERRSAARRRFFLHLNCMHRAYGRKRTRSSPKHESDIVLRTKDMVCIETGKYHAHTSARHLSIFPYTDPESGRSWSYTPRDVVAGRPPPRPRLRL